jgi:hypothetical protein
LGGIGLVSTLVALIVAAALTHGLSIRGTNSTTYVAASQVRTAPAC